MSLPNEPAEFTIYFIAIDNHLANVTQWSDLIGVTTESKIAAICPTRWQSVDDVFTKTQIESAIANVNNNQDNTGGWNMELAASRNLIDAIVHVRPKTWETRMGRSRKGDKLVKQKQ